MSIFRTFHLRHLRRQPLRTVLAAAALGAAVGTAVVAVVMVASIDRSLESTLRAFGGPAPLRVVGPVTRGGVPPDVVGTVAATEGVAAAVPMVNGVVIAQGRGWSRSVIAVGVDCRSEALFGEFGCDAELVDPRSNRPVLISAALAKRIGDDGSIRTDVGRIPIRGVVRNDRLDDTNGGGVVVFALQAAQRVLDRGDSLDAVYVKPEAGVHVDALRDRLSPLVGDHLYVLPRDVQSPWGSDKGPFIPLLGLTVLMGIGLSTLLVYNLVALSLAERRRDLAILSAVGTRSATLVRNLLAESAALGALGGIAGIVFGVVTARPIVSSVASVVTEQASGVTIDVHIPPAAYVIGMLVGVLTAVGAAAIPARRAMKVDLSSELHGRGGIAEATPRRPAARIVVLFAFTVVTLIASFLAQRNGALEPWQPTVGAVALAVSGFLSFGTVGAVAPVVLKALLRPLSRTGGVTRVAVANLVTQPRRTSVIAAAVGAAVGMGCVLGALIPAIGETVSTTDGAATDGRVYISTLPLNNASNIDARPSRDVVRRMASVPGVASVDEMHCVDAGETASALQVCGIEGAREIDYPLLAGDAAVEVLARGEAMLGTGIARVRGLRPGDTMRLATPNGSADVRVGGIWVYARENGYSVTLGLDRFRELYPAGAPHVILARPERGVGPAELASRIEGANLDPDLFALTPDEVTAKLAEEIALQVSPFWMMQRLLLVVALVGTLSTLLLIGVQRKREIGILGAVGFGPAALGRMTMLEALAAGAVGSVLGAVASSAVFETLRNSAATAVGARPPFSFSFGSASASIALALVVVALGGALPAWRASRLQIVEAIRDE